MHKMTSSAFYGGNFKYMSKYCGPRFRIVRRLFFSRFRILPSFTYKIQKNNFRPGQHRTKKTKKPTQFLVRLTEKQKLRTHYTLSEKQLLRYVKKARKAKGFTRTSLVCFLESRPDVHTWRRSSIVAGLPLNLERKFCLFRTLFATRQFISHIKTPMLQKHHFIKIPNMIKSIDDIFRFVQTSSEVSTLNRMASAVGYQPTIKISSLWAIIYFNPRLVVEYYSNRL